MSRLKSYAFTALSVVYLAGLWVYQLPESRVERALMFVFRPVQKITFTDRIYRMYAPDPRPAKRIPFLQLKTDLSPVRFLKTPPGFQDSWGLLPALSHEKWANFLDELGKALQGEGFFLSQEEGKKVFDRLAARVCREESSPGDNVRVVTFESRRVAYGEFRGDIVWDTPDTLETFECP